jgi:hypothetical protein
LAGVIGLALPAAGVHADESSDLRVVTSGVTADGKQFLFVEAGGADARSDAAGFKVSADGEALPTISRPVLSAGAAWLWSSTLR